MRAVIQGTTLIETYGQRCQLPSVQTTKLLQIEVRTYVVRSMEFSTRICGREGNDSLPQVAPQFPYRVPRNLSVETQFVEYRQRILRV